MFKMSMAIGASSCISKIKGVRKICFFILATVPMPNLKVASQIVQPRSEVDGCHSPVNEDQVPDYRVVIGQDYFNSPALHGR